MSNEHSQTKFDFSHYMQVFQFDSIRHMQRGDNYDVFIRVIGILIHMISGYLYDISPIHSGDVQCLSDLISDYLNDTRSDFIPLYIHKLFANIVQNVNTIHLDMLTMKLHDEAAKYQTYGYRLLRPLFFVDSMINFSKLCQLFYRDLQQIVIYISTPQQVDRSIPLNDVFLEQILCGILEINENIALKSVFKEILIANPFDSIDDFIDKNQDLFVSKGWTLNKTKYEDKERLMFKSHSHNALSISPL